MTRATNSGHPGAGLYASSRKGGVSRSEIRQAQDAIGARATPSMIARYLGRCEADIRALMIDSTPTITASSQPGEANDNKALKARPWPESEVKLLQVMYEEAGATVHQIAGALDRTERAIEVRIKQLGLIQPPDEAA